MVENALRQQERQITDRQSRCSAVNSEKTYLTKQSTNSWRFDGMTIEEVRNISDELLLPKLQGNNIPRPGPILAVLFEKVLSLVEIAEV